MAVSRRKILQAILTESRDRRGPVPAPLISIAVNAKSESDKLDVESELVSLRAEGLVAVRQDLRGNGLVVTDAGMRSMAGTSSATLNATPAPKPAAQRPAAEVPKPAPSAPASPPPEPASNASVEHYVLCCDLGELLCEEIRAAIAAEDFNRLDRVTDLAKRLLVIAKEIRP